MKVAFLCPICEAADQVDLAKPIDWQCSACQHRLHIDPPGPDLKQCAICGNHELYKQKDFPHRLGLTLLLIAFGISIFTYGFYHQYWTYAILIGTACFDGILYLMVGDALVCYRCHAYHMGFPAGTQHTPHEITVGERYRQERLRRQQSKPPI